MIKNRNFLVGYKIVFGLLALSSVALEMATLIGRGQFEAGNFFSYFTIESNLIAATVLLTSAAAFYQKFDAKQLATLDSLRGAATLYMVTTGIVFSVLLAGYDARTLTAVPWDNVVLHYIMPVALLVDWLFDTPHKRVPMRRAGLWLLFPLVYVAYSLIRGSVVGWYPYPFLNPMNNGYGGVVIVSLGIAATVAFMTWVLVGPLGQPRKKAYHSQ